MNFEIVDYILTYLLPQATVVQGKFSMLDVVFTFLFYKFFISSWRLSGQSYIEVNEGRRKSKEPLSFTGSVSAQIIGAGRFML